MCGTLRFRALAGWWERLRGLLGTGTDAEPVVLLGCSSIHTFGMRYAIDVAFADGEGTVLESRRAVPPCRVVSCRHGALAFERPASAMPWLEPGQVVVRGALALGQGSDTVATGRG